MTARIAQKMRIHNAQGERLYLNRSERNAFLEAAKHEKPEHRLLCHVLHDTGCRLSETLEITPDRISLDDETITLRTLKKRVSDHYRDIPVTSRLIDMLDLTFDLRAKKKSQKLKHEPLFNFHSKTAYRTVKRVMAKAEISGAQAMPKGLRHGFGIALLSGDKPAPLTIVSELLGHTDIETTKIYLQAVGSEKRKLVLQALG